jgi:hypothetical protein
MISNGKFIISLDFELMWGVFDGKTVQSYGNNIMGARSVIPEILSTFKSNSIAATWATVGLLFHRNHTEAKANLPTELPAYQNEAFSAYSHLTKLSTSEEDFYFAPALINLIHSTPKQEISTHTYSHYYCLEQGPTVSSFMSDLTLAKSIASQFNISIESIVFPRNQYSQEHLNACLASSIRIYRGNSNHLLYRARNKENNKMLIRIGRLIDSYINISGYNCYSIDNTPNEGLVNVPGSRFLRPYSPVLKFLEFLKIRRIKKSMTYAAKNKLMYHLWWHPHNFGSFQKENMKNLNLILEHYQVLKARYGFESNSMLEYSSTLSKNGK